MSTAQGRRVFYSNRQRKVRLTAAEARAAALAAAAEAPDAPLCLSVVVVGDRKMRQLNREFAGVDGTTDVLAFDLSGEEVAGGVEGEVVVNAAVAAAEAGKRGKRVEDELLLYVVHGVLHLGGYRDGTPAQKKRMRKAERAVTRRLRRASGKARSDA